MGNRSKEPTKQFVKLSQEGDKFLGHLRQSSGEGCRSLQNQDNLNFLRVPGTPLPELYLEAVIVTCPISIEIL
jgi:hypothetical protein